MPDLGQLYMVTSIPTISQVYLLYLAFLTNDQYGSGPESLETKLFSMDEIPWDELAFQRCGMH